MIKANNLTKKFGKNKALDNVTFEIPEGSIYGLVGSNGSGKSTFMRLISGVYMADGGEILVDNQNPFDNSLIKSKICYLPDTPYFIHQSNLNEMMRYYKMLYKDFDIDRFEQLLKFFPLDRRARISTMSKGMQRQAALILAISTKPKYLLLDEAFDGLDPIMRKVLKSLLAEGVSDGMTAIIASHNLRDLDELCDTVGILHNGKVLLNDDIENLRGGIHKVHQKEEYWVLWLTGGKLVVLDRTPDGQFVLRFCTPYDNPEIEEYSMSMCSEVDWNGERLAVVDIFDLEYLDEEKQHYRRCRSCGFWLLVYDDTGEMLYAGRYDSSLTPAYQKRSCYPDNEKMFEPRWKEE